MEFRGNIDGSMMHPVAKPEKTTDSEELSMSPMQ